MPSPSNTVSIRDAADSLANFNNVPDDLVAWDAREKVWPKMTLLKSRIGVTNTTSKNLD
jgi:hypothetical protein